MQGEPQMQNQQPKVASACPQRSEDSRLQPSGAASEGPDSDQQDQHVSLTEAKDSRFTDQRLCDWYEAQPETYLNYLYENFGANTPREAWAAHMDGKRTIRCACCDSSNLEQFCHLAPDPLFCCCNCGMQLNADGSVCVTQVDLRAKKTMSVAQIEGFAMGIIRRLSSELTIETVRRCSGWVDGISHLLECDFPDVAARIDRARKDRMDVIYSQRA